MIVAARRPLAAAGTALAAAGLIATSAIEPVQVSVPRLSDAAVALQASIFDIFTFPAWQQAIANEVEFVAIRATGLAEAGIGLAQSAAELPSTLVTAFQEVFSGNALDALTTIEQWALAAGEATLVPPIAANIEVGQIQLAIQSALLPAQPIALVEVGSGLFTAFDTISRAFIIAGQDFVDALVSFNIGAIVQAVIDGVSGVVSSFAVGGQAVVDGIVAAQTTLANALAARPGEVIEAAAIAPAAALAPSAPAPLSAVETPEPVAAPDRVTPADEVAPESAGPASDAAPAAPRRASARGAQGDVVADVTADTAAPKKSVAKRAARGSSAS